MLGYINIEFMELLCIRNMVCDIPPTHTPPKKIKIKQKKPNPI